MSYMNEIQLIARWQKQPTDEQDYDLDFEDWLNAISDTPGSFTVSVTPGITLVASERIGTIIKVWLAGGTVGARYRVTVTMTSTGGRIKQAEYEVRVKEV